MNISLFLKNENKISSVVNFFIEKYPEANSIYYTIISKNKQAMFDAQRLSIGKIKYTAYKMNIELMPSVVVLGCNFPVQGLVIRKAVECEIDTAIHGKWMFCFPLLMM